MVSRSFEMDSAFDIIDEANARDVCGSRTGMVIVVTWVHAGQNPIRPERSDIFCRKAWMV